MISLKLLYQNNIPRILLDRSDAQEWPLEHATRNIVWSSYNKDLWRYVFPLHQFSILLEAVKTVPDPERYWEEELYNLVTKRKDREERLTRVKNTPFENWPPFDFEKYFPKRSTLPQGFTPEQRAGVNFLVEGEGGAIFGIPGSGKTLQTIAALTLLHRRGVINRALVVTLSSVKKQFASEFSYFPGMTSIVIGGEIKQRHSSYRDKVFAYVTSHQLLLRDKELLRQIHKKNAFDAIVIDEIHHGVKDPQSQTSLIANELGSTAKVRIALTASPLENNLEENIAIMNWVEPGIFGTLDEARRVFIKINEGGFICGYQNLEEYRKIIFPYYVRQTDTSHYPPMTLRELFVDLTPEHMAFYKSVANQTLEAIADEEKQKKVNSADPLSIYTYQRQAIECSELIDPSTHYATKLEEVKRILATHPPEDRMIIYTPSERVTRFLQSELSEYKSVRFWGGLDDSCKRKTEMCDQTCPHFDDGCLSKNRWKVKFNTDKSYKILIMDDAGKEGLNTNANVVICYGLPWNPEVLAQLVGRAWGYGRAERPVIFYILLANNTLDIYMYETLLSKRELKEAIFNDLKTDSVTLAKSFNSWEIRDKIRQQLKDCARGAKTEKTV